MKEQHTVQEVINESADGNTYAIDLSRQYKRADKFAKQANSLRRELLNTRRRLTVALTALDKATNYEDATSTRLLNEAEAETPLTNQNVKVGDIVYMTGKNGKVYAIEVLGINHDKRPNGELAPITVWFKDLPINIVMNRTDTNAGGWEASAGRNYLNNDFIRDIIPDYTASKILPVVKKTLNGDEVTETIDKVFLLSEIEAYGKNYYSRRGEGKQYELCKDWKHRVKCSPETDYGCWHWLRSPHSGNYNNFCMVNSSGYYNRNRAYYSYGVAPCFAISSLDDLRTP